MRAQSRNQIGQANGSKNEHSLSKVNQGAHLIQRLDTYFRGDTEVDPHYSLVGFHVILKRWHGATEQQTEANAEFLRRVGVSQHDDAHVALLATERCHGLELES
jgi:hypothetical protein